MGDTWYFKDMNGQTQGPFSLQEMREWHVAGYLKEDLLIAQDPMRGFNALRDWYPNPAMAFTPGANGNPGRNAGADPSQDELKWYFLDKSRKVQGPFSTKNMRQWFEGGYFEPTLQIFDSSKPENEAGWKVLRDYFPNVDMAFMSGSGIPAPMPTAAPVPGPGGNAAVQNSRFTFPDWLPVPPPYKGVKKVYPSERQGAKPY